MSYSARSEANSLLDWMVIKLLQKSDRIRMVFQRHALRQFGRSDIGWVVSRQAIDIEKSRHHCLPKSWAGAQKRPIASIVRKKCATTTVCYKMLSTRSNYTPLREQFCYSAVTRTSTSRWRPASTEKFLLCGVPSWVATTA